MRSETGMVTSIAYGDAQTRGQIRHWKKKLAERYGQFDRAYNNTSAWASIGKDMICGSGLTRRRALDKLTKLFGPGVTFEKAEIKKRNEGYALWSILKPRSSVFVETARELSEAELGSLSQNCVSVNYVYVGVQDGVIYNGEGLWTLEVPDHALGRAVERSGFLTPEAIIREAHKNVLDAPVRGDWPDNRALLKAGAGCFAIEFCPGSDISVGGAAMFMSAPRHGWPTISFTPTRYRSSETVRRETGWASLCSFLCLSGRGRRHEQDRSPAPGLRRFCPSRSPTSGRARRPSASA